MGKENSQPRPAGLASGPRSGVRADPGLPPCERTVQVGDVGEQIAGGRRGRAGREAGGSRRLTSSTPSGGWRDRELAPAP